MPGIKAILAGRQVDCDGIGRRGLRRGCFLRLSWRWQARACSEGESKNQSGKAHGGPPVPALKCRRHCVDKKHSRDRQVRLLCAPEVHAMPYAAPIADMRFALEACADFWSLRERYPDLDEDTLLAILEGAG